MLKGNGHVWQGLHVTWPVTFNLDISISLTRTDEAILVIQAPELSNIPEAPMLADTCSASYPAISPSLFSMVQGLILLEMPKVSKGIPSVPCPATPAR